MRKFLLGLFAAAAVTSAGPLFAQEEGDLFTKLDANKDGFVTADEVSDDNKSKFERQLRNADKDGDKKLNKEEFAASLKPDDAPRQPLGAGAGPGRAGAFQFSPKEFFARMDANKDGKLGKDEVRGPLSENFARVDADSDGAISEEEFSKAATEFARLAGAAAQGAGGAGLAKELLARQDADKDGKISKEEAQGPLREGFDRIDSNSDGFVNEEELGQIASRLGARPGAGPGGARDPKELEALFDRTDANSDGKVTPDEIPENQREGFGRMLERLGSDSVNKEQFVRFMTFAAQQGRPDGRPGEPRPGAPGFRPPLISALDADGNGELSAEEIEAASKALLKLDRNGDGKLGPGELFPSGPVDGRPGGDRPANDRPAGAPGERPRGEGRPGAGEFAERLRAADANKDGKISKDEAPDRLKDNFDRFDANSDGFIDEAEMRQIGRRQNGGRRPDEARPDGDRRRDGDARPEEPKKE